jgi:hypothetical protein
MFSSAPGTQVPAIAQTAALTSRSHHHSHASLGHARLGVDQLHLEPEVSKVVPPFQILHSIPERIRIRIRDWQNLERSALEHRLRVISGVCAVLANPLTRHVLIRFDPPAAPGRS